MRPDVWAIGWAPSAWAAARSGGSPDGDAEEVPGSVPDSEAWLYRKTWWGRYWASLLKKAARASRRGRIAVSLPRCDQEFAQIGVPPGHEGLQMPQPRSCCGVIGTVTRSVTGTRRRARVVASTL